MKKVDMLNGFFVAVATTSPAHTPALRAGPVVVQRVQSLRIKLEKLHFDSPVSDSEVVEGLAALGVVLDRQSEVYIYDEENKIDLGCFNCLVDERSLNDLMVQSQNDRGPHSGYEQNE